MTKKIFIITSLIFLILILNTLEKYKQNNAFLAVQNNTASTPVINQPVPKPPKSVSSKKIKVPEIISQINTSINYYPNSKLPTKTVSNLLAISSLAIVLGISLLEIESVSEKIKFQLSKGDWTKNIFRFINRIL